jgi:hypothetical protein
MASKVKTPKLPQTRAERILARPKPAIGTYPGQNRARTFIDRKKEAKRKACRLKVNHR